MAKSEKIYPIKLPAAPPSTEKIVAFKKILTNLSFLAITIGTIMTSGGIGKKELSMKDMIDK